MNSSVVFLMFLCLIIESFAFSKLFLNTTTITERNLNYTKEIGERCLNSKCFPKCCPMDEIYHANGTCAKYGNVIFDSLDWDLFDYAKCDKGSLHNCQTRSDQRDGWNEIILGRPDCSGRMTIALSPEELKMFDAGLVHLIEPNVTNSIDEFCVDLFKDEDILEPVVWSCLPREASMSPVCDRDQDTVLYLDVFGYFRFEYFYGLIVSLVFMFTTVFVYLIVPELHAKIHGKSLISYCSNLFVGYLVLAILQFDVKSDIEINVCVVLSYIVIYAFLASFFWLNVMCFDIWVVFSGYGPSVGSRKEIEKKKFIFYSIYSWGMAALIFLVIVLMESSWIDFIDITRPEFGKSRCWFKTRKAELYYFFLPLAIILSINLFFFVMTTRRIIKISKETKILSHGDNKRNQEHEKQRFFLYVKLFIVMGINWFTELASFFYPNLKFWFITDITNTLQGVLIFIIFVCKRRILHLLKKKFRSSGSQYNNSQTYKSSNGTRNTSFSSNTDSIRMTNVSSVPNISFKATT